MTAAELAVILNELDRRHPGSEVEDEHGFRITEAVYDSTGDAIVIRS